MPPHRVEAYLGAEFFDHRFQALQTLLEAKSQDPQVFALGPP
jgi:hypothetical protein